MEVLKEFGVEYNVTVASAHRTPERVENVIKEAHEKGVKVFIAIAGLAAHLPGVVASKTVMSVIGVPVDSNLDGMDALLSIVQKEYHSRNLRIELIFCNCQCNLSITLVLGIDRYNGPKFGIKGIRKLVGAKKQNRLQAPFLFRFPFNWE